MLDLTPATGMLTQVVTDIGDDQLGAPTPCRETTVADLLDHLDGFGLTGRDPAWRPDGGN